MKTYSAKPGEVSRDWYVVDAEGQTLGRLATRIADTLRGKTKPQYTPHTDTGDFVIVVNAEKVVLTSDKADKKLVYTHSGYPGGLRTQRYSDDAAKKPEEAVRKAVRGMIPKTTLGRNMLKKLKVYAGPTHPHAAQGPQPLDLAAIAKRTA
jgi:large subunit ribosomal protein L13